MPAKVFIHEFISAGGLGPDAPASLRNEGAAMLAAVQADFQRAPDVEILSAVGPGVFALMIAPEFDDHLRGLSQAVLDAGGRLLGSSPDAIALTGDKLALAEYWRRCGVPHPRTELAGANPPHQVGPPWVVKPRTGAGSQATFVVRNAAHWQATIEATRREWPSGDLLWQPLIAGRGASVALLIGASETVPLLPAWQNLSTDDRFHYLGGTMPMPTPFFGRALRTALEAVQGIDGLCGYVGVDLILGDEADCVIEVNPRLTTSYLGLRQMCRQNLAELMLRCARGEEIGMPTWQAGETHFSVDSARRICNVGIPSWHAT